MIRGLYRTRDQFLGQCARVDPRAGDAAPFLLREIYDSLGGRPLFDELPWQDKNFDSVTRQTL